MLTNIRLLIGISYVIIFMKNVVRERLKMSDIKLFKIDDKVEELPAKWSALERELQTLIEKNMSVFFGVNFLKSEYTTSNGGRINSLYNLQ